jgi:two-component system NarL family response regulator
VSRPPLRVLLADDHPVVLEGLAALLAGAGMAVVATARTGEEAVALHARHRPDVTLLDLRMPAGGGVEAIRRIRAADPSARLLVLTTFDTDEEVFRAVEAGAAGYLLKTAPPEELTRAIADVAAGRRVIPPAIAARLADRVAGSELTPRELEVLAAVARGEGNREIARRLAITEGTVKGHVSNVLDKLGVRSRTQAVTAALARGLVRLGRRRPPE